MTAAQGLDFVHIMLAARQEARRFGDSALGVGHVFMALCRLGGLTEGLLRSHGVDPRAVRRAVAKALAAQDGVSPARGIHYTPELHAVLASLSPDAAAEMTADISEQDLLAAIAADGAGLPVQVLHGMGVDLAPLLDVEPHLPAATEASADRPPKGMDADAYKQLLRFGRDLTQLAREGRIHPAIGRDEEIGAVEQTLVRATKRNPVLLGEAGVGKTAIVEGLACRIAGGEVIAELRAKRIIEINLAQVTAGTTYRGAFEANLLKILDVARAAPDVILAIDELHTLVGAGAAAGGLDASNIMKPALARGDIQLIGATTREEYRKYIEPDAALERRFQVIDVDEPGPEDTVTILKGIRERFERHHKVTIEDAALTAAATLSARFLPNRRLPDKAIDLLDEACAYARLHARPGAGPAAPIPVTAGQIAKVLAEWSGLPVSELSREQRRRLLEMPAMLGRRVVGQDEAVQAVTRALETALAGLRRGDRPIGVMLFVGPTGVGKTELAKALAGFMFGSDKEMIRLDMSEYQERHQAARLIGAPPGYVGHEQAGLLTEGLRNKPYSVVLLDEVEKAHADVFDMFLQLFGEGRLTDAHGRTADGTNAIFILTSNLGSRLYGRHPAAEVPREAVVDECKRFFRPEFINRIDEIVVFKPLTEAHLAAIVEKFVAELRGELAQQNIDIRLETGVTAFIARQGYDPVYGARPLHRAFERLLVQPLAHRLVAGEFSSGSRVVVSLRNERLGLAEEAASRVRAGRETVPR